jgi:hypothetical protein
MRITEEVLEWKMAVLVEEIEIRGHGEQLH